VGAPAEPVSDRAPDAWRPRFHVAGERNWINDPNGPLQYEGVYHLFYQANSDRPFWGPPAWGHVSSTDLVTWTRHPHALEPEPGTPDADGCWSGCARIVDGRPAIYYTGVVDADEGRLESVCRAWASDGLLRWEKDACNPLVAGPPAELGTVHHLLDLIEEPPAERPVPAVQHRISGRYVRRQSL
jgi:beta-fructofuranosidase